LAENKASASGSQGENAAWRHRLHQRGVKAEMAARLGRWRRLIAALSCGIKWHLNSATAKLAREIIKLESVISGIAGIGIERKAAAAQQGA